LICLEKPRIFNYIILVSLTRSYDLIIAQALLSFFIGYKNFLDVDNHSCVKIFIFVHEALNLCTIK